MTRECGRPCAWIYAPKVSASRYPAVLVLARPDAHAVRADSAVAAMRLFGVCHAPWLMLAGASRSVSAGMALLSCGRRCVTLAAVGLGQARWVSMRA